MGRHAVTGDPRRHEHVRGRGATTRSREAIETAQLAATTAGHTQTEPIHLLAALLRDADGTARQLVGKAGADAASLAAQAEGALQALPKASGATVQQPAASPALTRVLAGALDLAASMKDDYVATEHLLISLATVSRRRRPCSPAPASPRTDCVRVSPPYAATAG